MPTFKPQYKDKNGIIQDLNIDYNSLANKPTTKNEIESLKSNINTLDKRVTSIESRLSDRIFKVDSDIAYTKTVPAGALPYASVDTLGGITKKYNQLFDKSKFPATQTTNGVTATHNGNGRITLSGTAIANVFFNIDSNSFINTIIGHKYLIKGGISTNISLYYNTNGFSDNGNGVIVTRGNTNGGSGVFDRTITIRVIPGTTCDNNVVIPQLIDLTEMYGAGNEPTTVEQFLADYPMYNNYVEYTEGALSYNYASKVVSKGVNLWDEEYVNVYINENGIPANSGSDFASKNYIKVIPNTELFYRITSTNYKGFGIYYYDINYNFISTTWVSQEGTRKHTTPNNCYYMKFYVNYPTYNNDICINVSNDSFNGTYKPYFNKSCLSNEIIAIKNKLVSLGYDENVLGFGIDKNNCVKVNLENKKAKIKYNILDLGTLSWVYNSSSNLFYDNSTNIFKYVSSSEIAKIICANYTTTSRDNISDKCCGLNVNSIIIKDTSYTDAETFKTAMSGVYLVYELATPVEIDLSDILTDDNFIEVEPNGTLTFENTYKNAVPSEVSYLVGV